MIRGRSAFPARRGCSDDLPQVPPPDLDGAVSGVSALDRGVQEVRGASEGNEAEGEAMKGGKYYRWWPTVMTCVLGLTLASGTISLVVSDIRDHDLSVIVRFVVGVLCGLPVGAIAIMVWYRRNPW